MRRSFIAVGVIGPIAIGAWTVQSSIDLGLMSVPLLLVVLPMLGYVCYFTIRLEMVIKPTDVSVCHDGIMFRNREGSERLHRWEDIEALTVGSGSIGSWGIVKLNGSWFHVPIPYEALRPYNNKKVRKGGPVIDKVNL